MARFHILKSTHKMAGIDLHAYIMVPPWPPKPGSPGVHVVAGYLHGTSTSCLKEAPSVRDEGSTVMQRCTDIGPFITPHLMLFPPAIDLLMPLYIATSASKSYFGASTVVAEKTPVATALAKTLNINLNCASTVGLGFVLAPNTVSAGMTIADLIGGLLQMIAEGVINYYLSNLLGMASRGLLRSLVKQFWSAVGPLYVAALKLLGNKVFTQLLQDPVSSILGDLLGTPLGYSVPHAPLGWLWDKGNKAVDAGTRYFNGPHPTFL